jgi:glycosyltransferase involved in cell wall biosynthesis
MSNHFEIVITSYNCEQWAEKNILSALQQKYDNFRVHYINDASDDSTVDIAQRYCNHSNFIIYDNAFRKGKMQNLCDVIEVIPDSSVVVILDGDDWLPDGDVLAILDKVYSNQEVWMTNGSYIVEPTGEVVKPNITESYWHGNIRRKSWEFSHLGTFRAKLFKSIKKKDLMNKTGEYWATTSDQAMMWAMAEMAGPQHFRKIEKVLYVYNRTNPNNDDRVHRQDQLETEAIIRSKKPYARLEKL